MKRRRVKTVVIHDRRDLDSPIANGIRVADAWPGGELIATEGLGHRRILRNREVIDQAVAFLVEGLAKHQADGDVPRGEGASRF